MPNYKLSTPNPFKRIKGDTISKTIKARNERIAAEVFYEWLAQEFEGHDPEVIACKELK